MSYFLIILFLVSQLTGYRAKLQILPLDVMKAPRSEHIKNKTLHRCNVQVVLGVQKQDLTSQGFHC